MNQRHYQIVEDPTYHYYKLNPLPLKDEMARFYETDYYDLIRKGGRACELRRLTAGGQEAVKERKWLHETLYSDIVHVLQLHSSKMRLLDIGCGSGEFLMYAKKNGFDAIGVEPSLEAASEANANGLEVHCSNFEEFLLSQENDPNADLFDAIIMLNVLEHIPDPVRLLLSARGLLKHNGLICIRVPNDFSEIQIAAQKKLKKDEWWVAAPDHINYFSFTSLNWFLQGAGFDVIHSQGDFPMELFLLMDEDYVGNPDIGNTCHEKRVSYELSVGRELRRNIYQALGGVGVGRNCLDFGRKK